MILGSFAFNLLRNTRTPPCPFICDMPPASALSQAGDSGPTEIAGFLGLLQLPYLKEIVDKREAIYQYLLRHINKGTINPTWMTKHSAFAFPIICKTSQERDLLVKKCSGIIEVRPIVGGDLTSQPFYNFKTSGVTTARKIHETGLYIGINPDMTQSDLDTIVRTIND